MTYITKLSRYVSKYQCKPSHGTVLYNMYSTCLNTKGFCSLPSRVLGCLFRRILRGTKNNFLNSANVLFSWLSCRKFCACYELNFWNLLCLISGKFSTTLHSSEHWQCPLFGVCFLLYLPFLPTCPYTPVNQSTWRW